MIDGVRLKFCGLRTLVDVDMADKLGADYLGFILHPGSPRYLALEDFCHLQPNLPTGRKCVAVVVEPTVDQLKQLQDAGFNRFQVHFRADLDLIDIEHWSTTVGTETLWLAPKRAPGTKFNPAWLTSAGSFLVDTFSREAFGGTGRTGDWTEFASLRKRYPEVTWILAGGLQPENIGEALTQTGANFLDVNSGVELAPGIKDHVKMQAVVRAIHQARELQRSLRHE